MILQKSKIYESNLFTEENLDYKHFRIIHSYSKNDFWYDFGFVEACKKDYRSLVKFFIVKSPYSYRLDVGIKEAIKNENEYIALSLTFTGYIFLSEHDDLYDYINPRIVDICRKFCEQNIFDFFRNRERIKDKRILFFLI